MTDYMPEPGFAHDLEESTYHADRHSISASGLKVMLQAPALFRYRQQHPQTSAALDFGTAAHSLVLGTGKELAVLDADAKRGKAWTEHAEAAKAEDKVALLRKEYEQIEAMADKLSEHSFAMSLLSDGEPEVSAYAIDEPTGLLRRCRFDYLKANVASDYKTTRDVSPHGFAKACATYGYDLSAAYYLDIAADLGHPLDAFALIAQAKEPPYLVEVYELDAEFIDRGRRRYRVGLERLRDCRESGIWPGYTGQQFTTLSMPRWATYEETA